MSATKLFLEIANALSGEIYKEISVRIGAVGLCADHVVLGIRHYDSVFKGDFNATFDYMAPILQDASGIHGSVEELILMANFFDHSPPSVKDLKHAAATDTALAVGEHLNSCTKAAIESIQNQEISPFFTNGDAAPDPAGAMARNIDSLKNIFSNISAVIPLKTQAALRLSGLWDQIAVDLHNTPAQAIEESRAVIHDYEGFLVRTNDFIPNFLKKLDLPRPA